MSERLEKKIRKAQRRAEIDMINGFWGFVESMGAGERIGMAWRVLWRRGRRKQE